jgi:hypothetical protein
MSSTANLRVQQSDHVSKWPSLNDLDPTLKYICLDILGLHENSSTLRAMSETGIFDVGTLIQLSESDFDQLACTDDGSTSPRPLIVGHRVLLRLFIRWHAQLACAWGVPWIADEQWRAIDPIAFKRFMEVCDMAQPVIDTIIPPMPPTTKVVIENKDLEVTSTFDKVAVNEVAEPPPTPLQTEKPSICVDSVPSTEDVDNSTQKEAATTSTILDRDQYANGDSEERNLPKRSKMVEYWSPQPAKGEPIATAAGGKIAKLIDTLADDDPTSVFGTSVLTLLSTCPDDREVAPPEIKVDTTTIADDDPSIMAAAAVTTSSPSWHDWLRKEVLILIKKRSAMKNQPESRDIIFTRSFNGENGTIDLMVHPMHTKSYCFEEFIFSDLTPTETTTVKNSSNFVKQQNLSEMNPSLKYICRDISKIREIPLTLFSVTTRKTELIFVIGILILIIQLSRHEFDEITFTSKRSALLPTSMMRHQNRLDPTGGETTPSPYKLLAEGKTSKTPTFTLIPLTNIFLSGEMHAKTIATTSVSLAQTKGKTSERMAVEKISHRDRLLLGQVRSYCSYLDSPVNKCTTSKKNGELSTTSHNNNDPLHQATDVFNVTQFTKTTKTETIPVLVQSRQPTKGEPTNAAARAEPGPVVVSAFQLTDDGIKPIDNHADNKTPADANAIDCASIDDAMHTSDANNCTDASGEIESTNLTSLSGQYNYSAGNTAQPPAINIDSTKLSNDDPRMTSMNDELSIPSWNDWSRKLSHYLTNDMTARQYRPDSRDIIFTRTFNVENGHIDLMICLSHHGDCVDKPHTGAPGMQKVTRWIGPRACAEDRNGNDKIPTKYKDGVDKHMPAPNDQDFQATQLHSTRAPTGKIVWTSDIPLPWKRDMLKSEENYVSSSEMALAEGECKSRNQGVTRMTQRGVTGSKRDWGGSSVDEIPIHG